MVIGKSVIAAREGLRLDGFQTLLNRSHSRGQGPKAIQNWTIEQNARRFDSFLADNGVKADDVSFAVEGVERKDAATDGFHLSRQLEYIHSQVMETPRPAFDGLELFPISSEVPAGARSHTVRRIERHGSAAVYRAGMEVPTVGLSQVEEEFPVRHYVSSYLYDVFEQASSDFARTGVISRKATECRDEITALWNRNTWHGDEANGIYGVLNYPWLAKKVSSVNFSSATADEMVAELHALANHPTEASKRTFSPNKMVVSTELYHLIATKRLGVTADGANETVLSFFLKTSPYIKDVVASHELSEVGPGGTDGILVYRDDAMGIQNMLVQGVTALPVQSQGFESYVYMYASHGGVVMRDIGNNALMWVER